VSTLKFDEFLLTNFYFSVSFGLDEEDNDVPVNKPRPGKGLSLDHGINDRDAPANDTSQFGNRP